MVDRAHARSAILDDPAFLSGVRRGLEPRSLEPRSGYERRNLVEREHGAGLHNTVARSSTLDTFAARIVS